MSFPGQLVNTLGLQIRAAVTWENWLTLLGFLHGPEPPRTAGQPCGHSDQDKSRLRYRVDFTGHGTRARVAQDCWSNPRALGHSPSHPGELFNTAGHRT